MASNLSLPIPPRTPTPPADDNYNDAANNPVPIDRDALSPLRDTFPKSVSLDPSSQSLLSPTKASFNLNAGSVDMATSPNGSLDATPAGPFNFNTTVMAKAPVVKSVRALCLKVTHIMNSSLTPAFVRTLDNVVVTSTSTVVYHTKSSSNLHLERLWLFRTPFPFQHSRNAVLACRRSRRHASGGVFAICLWLHIHCGWHMDRWQ